MKSVEIKKTVKPVRTIFFSALGTLKKDPVLMYPKIPCGFSSTLIKFRASLYMCSCVINFIFFVWKMKPMIP